VRTISLAAAHRIFSRPMAAEGGEHYAEILREETDCGASGNIVISTADHAAPFNRLGTLSFALPAIANQIIGNGNHKILLLPGSLIPCDNRLYPRGLFLPGESEPPRRINFVPKNCIKASPLLIPPVEAAKFGPFEKDIGTLDAGSYAHQLCHLMKRMASGWVRPAGDIQLDVKPLECAASRILIRLLEENDGYASRLLFDPQFRSRLYTGLEGTFCAWGKRHGTFLFWIRGACGRVRRLAFDSKNPESELDAAVLNDRGECINALKEKLIFPNGFLSLFLISYLPGIPVVGGPMQWRYYRKMIRVCNALFEMKRPLKLSRYGYMCVDPRGLSCYSGEPIPKFGSGMYLYLNPLDHAQADALLREIHLVRHIVRLPAYD
jgi:hypothetical protein